MNNCFLTFNPNFHFISQFPLSTILYPLISTFHIILPPNFHFPSPYTPPPIETKMNYTFSLSYIIILVYTVPIMHNINDHSNHEMVQIYSALYLATIWLSIMRIYAYITCIYYIQVG